VKTPKLLIFKNPVHTSQKTYHFSVTKISLLMCYLKCGDKP